MDRQAGVGVLEKAIGPVLLLTSESLIDLRDRLSSIQVSLNVAIATEGAEIPINLNVL